MARALAEMRAFALQLAIAVCCVWAGQAAKEAVQREDKSPRLIRGIHLNSTVRHAQANRSNTTHGRSSRPPKEGAGADKLKVLGAAAGAFLGIVGTSFIILTVAESSPSSPNTKITTKPSKTPTAV